MKPSIRRAGLPVRNMLADLPPAGTPQMPAHVQDQESVHQAELVRGLDITVG
jgi:hypothetical protein